MTNDVVRERHPIETAPKDGTEILAKIPNHGSYNVIAWKEIGPDWGGWCFTRDQEPPDSWTDGICWEVNEDLEQSVEPTYWMPLEALTQEQGDR